VPGIPFVVPFGADGAADRAARDWAQSPQALRFADGSRPDFRFENLPGEGGLLGVERANELARAGHRVLLLGTPSTHILLPARLGEAARVDEAFVPLAELPSAPNVLLVSPRLGVRTVDELVERARRERLTYASAGTGQTIHVCTAHFCASSGIAMTHRPYDAGSATAYDDLLAGRVHVFFDNLLACRERIERGDVRMLAESTLDVWLGVFGAHVGPGLLEGEGERLAQRIEASRVEWRRALAGIG
jgi:tripartite-type tricarboxylate transporter receptor subunit TctC